MNTKETRDGFTLMEAVVSIAIVSIGFVGIYSVFVVAEKSLAKTFEKNRLILTASSMIEDIGSDQINIQHYKEMNLDSDRIDYHYDNIESEKRLRKIRSKWKKRLERSKHKNLTEAPTKLQDILVDEGAGKQNLLTIETEGRQGVNVIFHRLFRKPQE
jgi:prepilin-type N-terminal cleavage/methylation domain-containing protein